MVLQGLLSAPQHRELQVNGVTVNITGAGIQEYPASSLSQFTSNRGISLAQDSRNNTQLFTGLV